MYYASLYIIDQPNTFNIMADNTLQRTQARFLKELFYGSKGGFVLKGAWR